MALDTRARSTSSQSKAEAEARKAEESSGEATIQALGPNSTGRRREYSRFAVELDVTVGSEHNFYGGFAENLSAGGVFVATHKLKEVGSQIDLSIKLPDGSGVKGIGEVRWVRIYNEHSDVPPGMGVRFIELQEGAGEAIERFLERREPLFYDDE